MSARQTATVEAAVESWKRAPTHPTRPAWRRDTATEQPATVQPADVAATPEVLPSTPEAPAPQPPYEMPDRLARALRRWGEASAVPAVVARDHG